MDLTSSFNSAAGGPSGEPGTVGTGPAPQGPSDYGSASAEALSSEASATSAPETRPSVDFESASADHQFASNDNSAEREFSVTDAEAELEMQEGGRAKPAARNNLNPPTQLKKIVDSDLERKREARVSALKAYLQFNEKAFEERPEHELSEDVEFRL